MKLLHVTPTYLPATRYGGPIYSVHGMCKALAAHGHEVYVYTTSVDGPGDSDVQHGMPVDMNGLRVCYFRSRMLRRLYWSPQMGRALRTTVAGFDLVHIHSVFLWPTRAAARACWRAGVPYLLAPRGMLVPELIRQRGWLRKSLSIRLLDRAHIERAAAVHVTSEAEALDLRRFGFRLPRIALVPNGVEVSVAEDHSGNQSAIGREGNVVLFLGRLNWKKGLDRLLEAIAQVPDAQLWIAGNDEDDYLPTLHALAKMLDLAARVRFLGPVFGQQKHELFRRATVFALPSYSENFGNAVLEAMAEGCPVLVTPEVGLATVITQSGAGLVCHGDPDKLAVAIQTLLKDKSRRQAMGEAGRRVVRGGYSWNAVADRMENCYQSILSGNATVMA